MSTQKLPVRAEEVEIAPSGEWVACLGTQKEELNLMVYPISGYGQLQSFWQKKGTLGTESAPGLLVTDDGALLGGRELLFFGFDRESNWRIPLENYSGPYLFAVSAVSSVAAGKKALALGLDDGTLKFYHFK